MANKNIRGAVAPADTVKAACGIRYNPDELDDDTGFDFSGAQEILEDRPDPDASPTTQNPLKPAKTSS